MPSHVLPCIVLSSPCFFCARCQQDLTSRAAFLFHVNGILIVPILQRDYLARSCGRACRRVSTTAQIKARSNKS